MEPGLTMMKQNMLNSLKKLRKLNLRLLLIKKKLPSKKAHGPRLMKKISKYSLKLLKKKEKKSPTPLKNLLVEVKKRKRFKMKKKNQKKMKEEPANPTLMMKLKKNQ